MGRKAVQVPGAIPAVTVTNPPAADTHAPETPQAKAQTAGRVGAADVDEVLAAEAAPVKAAEAAAIDPTKLKRAVFIEGQGWLCPQPETSTQAQR